MVKLQAQQYKKQQRLAVCCKTIYTLWIGGFIGCGWRTKVILGFLPSLLWSQLRYARLFEIAPGNFTEPFNGSHLNQLSLMHL